MNRESEIKGKSWLLKKRIQWKGKQENQHKLRMGWKVKENKGKVK